MSSKKEILERNRNKMTNLRQEGSSSDLPVKTIQAELISLLQQIDILESNIAAYKHSLSLFIDRDASLKPKLALIGNLSYGFPGSNVFRSLTSHDPIFESILGVRLVLATKLYSEAFYLNKSEWVPV